MSLASGAAVADAYYLRGGIGLDRPGGTAFTDTDCSSTSPAALYGCGAGGDGAPYRAAGEFGTAPAVELGIGYATGAIRFEVLVEYRPDFAFEGRANFLAPERRQDVSAKLSSVSGMLAGFVDLAALGLPKPGPFAPFLGAGIGAARTRIPDRAARVLLTVIGRDPEAVVRALGEEGDDGRAGRFHASRATRRP